MTYYDDIFTAARGYRVVIGPLRCKQHPTGVFNTPPDPGCRHGPELLFPLAALEGDTEVVAGLDGIGCIVAVACLGCGIDRLEWSDRRPSMCREEVERRLWHRLGWHPWYARHLWGPTGWPQFLDVDQALLWAVDGLEDADFGFVYDWIEGETLRADDHRETVDRLVARGLVAVHAAVENGRCEIDGIVPTPLLWRLLDAVEWTPALAIRTAEG